MLRIHKLSTEMLKDLVTIKFSEEGSNRKLAETAAWIHFIDFLDECAGKGFICYKLKRRGPTWSQQ